MTDIKHTRDVYNKFSKEYHEHIISPTNLWHRYIEKPELLRLLKPLVKGKKVLDLGCGSGVFTKRIKDLGGKVTGLDLSVGLIEIAKKEYPKIPFFSGDAKKTLFNDEEFNVVYASLVPHYFKDIRPFYNEVHRILAPSGYFIFSMHHPLMEVTRESIILENKKYHIINPYFHNDKYHWKLKKDMDMIAYHHTFENIINNLIRTGFSIEEITESKPPKKMKKIDLKAYRRSITRPSFLIIKSKKK